MVSPHTLLRTGTRSYQLLEHTRSSPGVCFVKGRLRQGNRHFHKPYLVYLSVMRLRVRSDLDSFA